jgi:hypothetical protein
VKVLAVFGDAELLVKTYLAGALAARAESYAVGASVGLILPAGWTRSAAPFVLVAWDGTPAMTYPAMAAATVRLTAWHATASKAKALVGLAHALVLNHPGGDGIASVNALTGVLPAIDDDNGADIASVTVRVHLRSTVLPA